MQVGQKCNIEDMRRSKNTPPSNGMIPTVAVPFPPLIDILSLSSWHMEGCADSSLNPELGHPLLVHTGPLGSRCSILELELSCMLQIGLYMEFPDAGTLS